MSIGVNGSDIESGLAMQTEDTTSIVDQSWDWDRDAITMVLLKEVGGSREIVGYEACIGWAWPCVGVTVWQARAGRKLGAEGWRGAAQDSRPEAAVTRLEVVVPCFFFLGADTCFCVICFPNAMRASLSCLSVPRIETMHSEWLLTS